VLSRTARYAVRVAVHIAEYGGETPLLVRDMADRLEVPRNYLSKVCHRLARAGVLTSTRGRGGGFALGRSADEITLTEVIECVEPADVAGGSSCLLGRPECTDADPCAAHEAWCGVRDSFRAFLRETTLAALARDAGRAPG